VSVNGLRSINPAVLDETDPHRIDPSLDPFSTKNGFNPNGPSHYRMISKSDISKAQAIA